MTSQNRINEIDKVEILTLQDNYIDLTATDNNRVVKRALPLRDGEFRRSILSEHGFSALVQTTSGHSTHTVLFDTGFSEIGASTTQTPWESICLPWKPLPSPTVMGIIREALIPWRQRSPARGSPLWLIRLSFERRATSKSKKT